MNELQAEEDEFMDKSRKHSKARKLCEMPE